MRVRICPGLTGDRCGLQTTHGSGRCDLHNRGFRRSVRNPAYDDPAWRRLRERVLKEWRAKHGDWCPGFGRAGHETADLTVDHVKGLVSGGLLLGPTQVLCRGCNTRKRWADTPTRVGP